MRLDAARLSSIIRGRRVAARGSEILAVDEILILRRTACMTLERRQRSSSARKSTQYSAVRANSYLTVPLASPNLLWLVSTDKPWKAHLSSTLTQIHTHEPWIVNQSLNSPCRRTDSQKTTFSACHKSFAEVRARKLSSTLKMPKASSCITKILKCVSLCSVLILPVTLRERQPAVTT